MNNFTISNLGNVAKMAGYAPVAMVLVALVGFVLAGKQISAAIQIANKVQESTTSISAKVDNNPLDAGEYQALAETMRRLHPNVIFSVQSDKALRVSIDNSVYYSDWVYAVSTLNSKQPGVTWEANEFCVGRCKSPASVVVSGIRQSVSIKDK